MSVSVDTSIGNFDAGDGFSIALGQEFDLLANLEQVAPDWFSNNDPVLAIEPQSGGAHVKATKIGSCEVRIYSGDTLLKKLSVEVIAPKNEAKEVKVKTKVEPLEK